MLEWSTKMGETTHIKKSFFFMRVFFQTKENKPMFATCPASFQQADFEFT